MPSRDTSWTADRIGAYASFACAIHCLVTSLALGLLSVAGLSFLGSFAADLAFITFAIGVGAYAVYSGYKKHRSFTPLVLFCVGLALVVASHVVSEHRHEDSVAQVSTTLEALSGIVAVLGGLTLVSFHFANARLVRSTGCQCPDCRAERDQGL